MEVIVLVRVVVRVDVFWIAEVRLQRSRSVYKVLLALQKLAFSIDSILNSFVNLIPSY